MVNVFRIADVVDLGIEKEKARRDFYDQVAQNFDDAEMKDLFAKLRDWEENHIQKFQSIRDSLGEMKPTESYPGELDAYMKALVNDQLYTEVNPENFSHHVKEPLEAVNYGIEFEKDAILFFMELNRFVQSNDKEVIAKLVEEERGHVIHLIKMKRRLKNID
jgi:rubrerythrin